MSFIVYIEGWGLYIEEFVKDMGFYKDFYFDFGCLVMEFWCVCRFVVDMGIYVKKWMCEEVVDYFVENMLNFEYDV